jgi:hypothetical protein
VPDLREQTIRLAYANSALRPHLLAALKQGAAFTLYREYLAWKDELSAKEDYSHPGMNLRMDWRKAEHSSEKTFEVLANLWYKDADSEAKLHAWASRIRDPNVAVSMAYTAHKLANADFTRFDNEYFYQNWKANATRFKVFGALAEKACEARFWEIAGRDSRVKPEAPPAAKSTFTPPPIPPNLIPTTADGWQLYDSPGAGRAARALATAMETILTMAGRNILPTNKDADNAKKVYELRARMNKVFSTYGEWGATDGEPESVFRSVLRRYVKTYLDDWTFSKTFDALGRFG